MKFLSKIEKLSSYSLVQIGASSNTDLNERKNKDSNRCNHRHIIGIEHHNRDNSAAKGGIPAGNNKYKPHVEHWFFEDYYEDLELDNYFRGDFYTRHQYFFVDTIFNDHSDSSPSRQSGVAASRSSSRAAGSYLRFRGLF